MTSALLTLACGTDLLSVVAQVELGIHFLSGEKDDTEVFK